MDVDKAWCQNVKYAQECFSIPTHIQSMDKMNLQFKEYTVLQKPKDKMNLQLKEQTKIEKTTSVV